MKTKLLTIIAAVGLLVTPIAFTGCNTTPTADEVVYRTLAITVKAVNAAEDAYVQHRLDGKISSDMDEQFIKLDTQFRAAFNLAISSAQAGLDGPAPEAVASAADDLVTFINSL